MRVRVRTRTERRGDRVEGCSGCLSEVFERKNDVKRSLCRKVVAGHGELAVRCCMFELREVR